ncbi:YegP family protein [Frigoribacterium faeni]|uniref:YegP family protein n=1 Tax=Frigoribacterium faeni TaxID=145483 RepID=UPI00141BF4B3|nr:DUF1508 domain-containing protein [Frigoribacterium faeni]NIJ04969.1 hypothetical protein [Frigoribacterium faeni]
MAGKFIVTQDESGEYRFVLTAGSGEVIVTSEGYKQKGAALNAIDSVRRTAVDAVTDDRTPEPTPAYTD